MADNFTQHNGYMCLCNDKHQCPLKANAHRLSASDRKKIKSMMGDMILTNEQNKLISIDNESDNSLRLCVTKTVCLTKRFRKDDGTTWLKYTCDSAPPTSLRNEILQFRDCMSTHALKVESGNYELCCKDQPFCNIKLVPKSSILDLNFRKPYLTTTSMPSAFKSNVSENMANNNDLLNPINLVLVASFTIILLFGLFLMGIFLVKRYRRGRMGSTGETKSSHLKSTSSSILSNNSNHAKQNSYLTEPFLSNGEIAADNRVNKKLNIFDKKIICDLPFAQHDHFQHQNQSGNHMINNNININQHNTNTNSTSVSGSGSNNNSPLLYGQSSQLLSGYNQTSLSYTTTSTSVDNNNINTTTSPLISVPELHSQDAMLEAMDTLSPLEATQTQNNYPNEYEWSGSGSGAGNPQCVALTIARQIKLIYPSIGKGRFGEVYKGEWRAGFVAVKTFNSADEKSWQNELKIYSTTGFRHENILGFISADNIDRGTYTELWLITDFHENGSLFDYLSAHEITPSQALDMCLSIVNGLVHLHMPIESVHGKPALAHCDLKSKNVLVKADLTCCISDFGLALSGDKNGRILYHNGNGNSVRTGTKRYMAPEILSKSVDLTSLTAFQRAEMYSLALIIWELLTRCTFESNGQRYSFDYQLPYYEHLEMDPDEMTMRRIVCDEKRRPIINDLWKQISPMNEMACLVEELWTESPSQRLSALRVKKSLGKLK